ncbi:MAG: TIGR00180 family glycosyltransferase [Pseudomonadota bacterium]
MITIVIPTMNRSDFLIRLLNYYADTGYKHWISIGDSSDVFHLNATKQAIKGLAGELKIVYREFPGVPEPKCTSQLIQEVKTPHVAFVADDDFLVPSALDECVEFLKDHPDYSVALGKAMIFNLGCSGPFGNISGVGPYALSSIEAASGRERLLYHLRNYSNPNFGVHRTEEFQRAYSRVPALPDKSFTEILPNCMSSVQGKIMQLDCFYLVRQGHDQRYLLPDLFDWVTSTNWLPSYQTLSDCLTEELVKIDGIEAGEARDVVKQAFWSYLGKGLANKFYGRYGQRLFGNSSVNFSRTKNVVKRIPAVAKVLMPAWCLLRSRINPSGVSLPVLLNTASPYHADFMPVYRAVTKANNRREICK